MCKHFESTPEGIIIDKRNNIHYRYAKDLIDDNQCQRVCGDTKCKFITILESRRHKTPSRQQVNKIFEHGTIQDYIANLKDGNREQEYKREQGRAGKKMYRK